MEEELNSHQSLKIMILFEPRSFSMLTEGKVAYNGGISYDKNVLEHIQGAAAKLHPLQGVDHIIKMH